MVKEDDLSIIGITKEEWEQMNVFKLTMKYTKAKEKISKVRVPDDVKEKNIMTLNLVYDELKQILRSSKTETVEVSEESSSKEVSIEMMLPNINLPRPLQGINNIKTVELPTPKKYMDKGVVLKPESLNLKLGLEEIVIPANKKSGDVLVYTDLANIVLLTVKGR